MKLLCLFGICLFPFVGITAQEFAPEKGTQEIIISRADSSVLFNVMRKAIKIQADADKEYYWYHQNKINRNRGGYFGKLLHGEYCSFDQEKRLISKGMFDKGLKVGTWLNWHDNGAVAVNANWKSGLLSGKVYEYYDTRSLKSVREFKKGKKCSAHFAYHLDGKLLAITRYRNDLKHGKESIYVSDKPVVNYYKKGELVVRRSKDEPKQTRVAKKSRAGDELQKDVEQNTPLKEKRVRSKERNAKKELSSGNEIDVRRNIGKAKEGIKNKAGNSSEPNEKRVGWFGLGKWFGSKDNNSK
jgi:hypothetical protein